MKRRATTDLSRDGSDEEEQQNEDEIGKFPVAEERQLKTRIIKTAVRRLSGNSTNNSKSIFSEFTGFSATKTGEKQSFSFVPKVDTSQCLNSDNNEINQCNEKETKQTCKNTNTIGEVLQKNPKKESAQQKYNHELKSLNYGFAEWIMKHVTENPLCNLTITFKDYENHLKTMRAELLENVKDEYVNESVRNDKKGVNENSSASSSTPNTNIFLNWNSNNDHKSSIFGTVITSNASPRSDENVLTEYSSPMFKFGENKNNFTSVQTTSSPVFKFGENKNNSTALQEIKNEDEDESNANSEDEDKTSSKVTEDGALYSKRCKLFFKQNDEYKDQGIVILFLKLVNEGKKCQLIARLDSSLGTIKLNCLLTENVPLKKLGKNNVMLICCPAPDMPPTTVLFRVKTSEEADEIIENVNKYRK